MDDQIKKRLEGYKPVFKEEYWQAVESELDKKRKRKFGFWWYFGIGGSMLLGIVLLYFVMQPASENNPIVKNAESTTIQQKHTIDDKQDDIRTPNIKNGLDKSASIDQTDTDKRSISATKGGENSEAKSEQRNIKSSNEQTTFKNVTTNKETEKKTNKSTNAFTPKNNLIARQSATIDNTIVTRLDDNSQDDLIHAVEDENILQVTAEQDGSIAKSMDDIQFKRRKVLIADLLNLDQLGLTQFPVQFGQRTLPTLAIAPISIKKHKPTQRIIPGYVASLSYNLLTHQDGSTITNEGVQLQRLIPVLQNTKLFTSVGIGASRYAGDFSSIQDQTVSYRSFAENTQRQSLDLKQAYYINLPLHIGLELNKWHVGASIKPERLLAAKGDITTTVMEENIVSTGPSNDDFQIVTTESVQKSTSWLVTDNLRSWNIPVGVFVDYKVGRHINVGVTAETFASGFLKFNNLVQGQSSATGNTNQIKGGLYVSYTF